MNITKKIKAIVGGAAGLLLLLVIILGGTVSSKNKSIRKYKETIANQEITIKGQNDLIVKLANMEAVRCEVSITVKNTAVMGSNKSGAISQDAKQMAVYLRGEILESMGGQEQNNNKANQTKK